MKTADVIVIGGGIAGASAAAEIAADGARVVLLEMESQPGYHTTGRSAAMYEPSEGVAIVRALTRASFPFLATPPDGFTDVPLLSPRGVLMFAYDGQEALATDAKRNGFVEVDASFARAKLPLLKLDGTIAILWDGDAQDVDVDALHGGRLRALPPHEGRAGRRRTRPYRRSASAEPGAWMQATRHTKRRPWCWPRAHGATRSLHRAASCRSDCSRNGAAPRSSPGPVGAAVEDWPEISPVDVSFYCKPMGGKLMLSPADAEPVEPHDAWADDLRLAEAAAGLEGLVDMSVQRLERTWGGLRTFAPDGLPVVGFDPDADGFFWLAGQGGYGIQTSPALSRLAAALVARREIPADLAREGIALEPLSPRRFR